MEPLRLVLITRRFWPLVGGAEKVMSNLGNQMQIDGHSVRLLTARWESHWPKELSHREIQITRLAHSTARGWGTLRYMRGLARWLRSCIDDYDAVLVSMLKHDAYAAIGALQKTDIPVIVRAEGGGATGDCHWHGSGRFGRRIQARCRSADAIIAPSEAIAEELRQSGFASEQVRFISNGVEIWDEWSETRQFNARATLADAHEVLHVDPKAPLAVFTGRLHESKGLIDLIKAWPRVLKEKPNAKLWLVGEGPDSPRLWDRIRDLDLAHEIILPGSFDEISEVLHAADVYVLPSYEEGMSIALLEAMSAGVPIVATDIPGNRHLIEGGVHGTLFPPHNVEALTAAIDFVLNNSEEARTMAQQARSRVQERFSIQRMTDQHCKIIRQAIQQRKMKR